MLRHEYGLPFPVAFTLSSALCAAAGVGLKFPHMHLAFQCRLPPLFLLLVYLKGRLVFIICIWYIVAGVSHGVCVLW